MSNLKHNRVRELMEKIKDWWTNTCTKSMRTSLIVLLSCLLGVGFAMIGHECFIQDRLARTQTPSVEETKINLDSGEVKTAIYYQDEQVFEYQMNSNYSLIYSTLWGIQCSDERDEIMSKYPNIKYSVTATRENDIFANLRNLLLIAAAISFLIFAVCLNIRRNELKMEGSDSKEKTGNEIEAPDVTFNDVAGCEEAKREVAEVVDFLRNPEKYTRLGAKIPHGIIMAGNPGTGKTLLAKATAGESNARFFQVAGSQFDEKYVGVGASRVRDLFERAKKAAPAIIFIDEIDAMGKKRSNSDSGASQEGDKTLNQLLVCMDGFGASDDVIVMAATNRIDTLDPALLRPGRFDRHVEVDLPSKIGRYQILEVHMRNKPVSSSVDLDRLSTITAGMSGADLANLCNEAAIYAARREANEILPEDFEKAFERITAGTERKDRVMNIREKRTTSYHEVGHALVGHLLPHADKVSKISIVSRGRALGYTLTEPEEDRFLYTKEELEDKLAMFYGGIVAEEIVNDGNTSTGPSNDLERAAKMARSMVTRYGMSELGKMAFISSDGDTQFTKPWSDCSGKKIDDEVAAILKRAHDKAKTILLEHWEQFDMTASVLYEREVIDGEEMVALLDGQWQGTWESIFDCKKLIGMQEHSIDGEHIEVLRKSHLENDDSNVTFDSDNSSGNGTIENFINKTKDKLHLPKTKEQETQPTEE